MAMTMHVDVVSAEKAIFSGLAEFMAAPGTQGERIAVMEQRLKSGDTILEELSKGMKDIAEKVSTLLHHVEGADGILAKQKEHGTVISKITNLEIVEKVGRHDKWYIIGAFLIGFLGLTSVSSIIALLVIVVRLFNTIH